MSPTMRRHPPARNAKVNLSLHTPQKDDCGGVEEYSTYEPRF